MLSAMRRKQASAGLPTQVRELLTVPRPVAVTRSAGDCGLWKHRPRWTRRLTLESIY
jgi:hypothetical protein